MDGDEVFECYKDLLEERNNFASKVEHAAEEKEEPVATVAKFAKVIIDLQARLQESKSKLKKSKLESEKERDTNKEFEEQLLAFKKKVVEQHQKGFYKAVRPVGVFTKGLDLSLFDPFKDVNDSELLDEEEMVVVEEDTNEEQDDGANVQVVLSVFLILLSFWLCKFDNVFLVSMHLLLSTDGTCYVIDFS